MIYPEPQALTTTNQMPYSILTRCITETDTDRERDRRRGVVRCSPSLLLGQFGQPVMGIRLCTTCNATQRCHSTQSPSRCGPGPGPSSLVDSLLLREPDIMQSQTRTINALVPVCSGCLERGRNLLTRLVVLSSADSCCVQMRHKHIYACIRIYRCATPVGMKFSVCLRTLTSQTMLQTPESG